MMYILSVLILILAILLIVKIRRGMVVQDFIKKYNEHKVVTVSSYPTIYYEGVEVSVKEFDKIIEGEYDILDVSVLGDEGIRRYLRGPKK